MNNSLRHIWLIGSLFRVGRKTYSGAFYEFIYLFLWSILPFLLGGLTLYVTSDAANKNYFLLGLSTVRNGELLVFTISMLAPILYLVLHDPDQAEAFPHKLPISTAVALIIVTCAALFALMKANAVKDSEFVFILSVILTLIALIFRYLALVYHRLRMPEVSELELREGQVDFVQKYREHVDHPETTDQGQQAADFANSYGQHVDGNR